MSVIREGRRRIEGAEKATGITRFTADLELPGLLHVHLVLSHVPSAMIRNIDRGALDRDLFVVVEQDMYPCDFGQPKPIAQRTYTYLRGLGIGIGEE